MDVELVPTGSAKRIFFIDRLFRVFRAGIPRFSAGKEFQQCKWLGAQNHTLLSVGTRVHIDQVKF